MEDLSLAIQNIIRLGTIYAVKHSNPPCVRVQTGDLISNWVSWVTLRAGQTKTWNPPTVGEQVILLSPGGDLTGAFALGAIYSDFNAPPEVNPTKTVTQYPDGAWFEYDHASSTLTIKGIKHFKVQAEQSATVETPQTTWTGNITQSGSHVQQGGVISSNGIVLDSHVHSGVSPGNATTGGPV